MLNLIMPQIINLLKAQGFDFEKVQKQVIEAVDDIHAMKLSQDRTETMVRHLYNAQILDKGRLIETSAGNKLNGKGLDAGAIGYMGDVK